MKKQIAKLIDLKSIITIIITGSLVYGFVVGKVNTEQFMTIATMVFTFYFSKKKEGDDNMATTDNRSVEEIKQELEQCKPIEETEKVEEKEGE